MEGNEDVVLLTADFKHIQAFNQLVSVSGGLPLYKAIFGQFNYSTIVEFSYISLVYLPQDNIETSYGFIAVNDSSYTLSSDDGFVDMFDAIKALLPITAMNSLFINFFSLDERQKTSETIGKSLIRKIFELSPNLDFLLWLCPYKSSLPTYVDRTFSLFEETQLLEENEIFKGKKLLFVHRSNFLSKLLVREAMVEDSDDLIPILKNNAPQILEGQEHYFLADLIQSQDERNRFFVGLDKSDVVGVIATSLDVNVSLITKIFDIDNYSDLVIQKEEIKIPPPLLIAVMGDIRLVDARVLSSIVNKIGCVFIDVESFMYEEGGGHDENEDTHTGTGGTSADADDTEEKYDSFSSVEIISKLKGHMETIIANRKKDGDVTLACVLLGFPRSEEDADAMRTSHFSFHITLEIQNISEDLEIDDNDDYLNSHLDAVEIYRRDVDLIETTNYNIDSRPKNNDQYQTIWKKMLVDNAIQGVTDTTKKLSDDVRLFIESRSKEVERLQNLHSEETARANAFAITVFCIEEEFISRAEDMLKVAFEEHPALDYCLMMMSCNTAPTGLTRLLTHISVKDGISFDQSLFIMHRDALLALEHFKIVRYNKTLMPSLDSFLMPVNSVEKAGMIKFAQSALRENDVDLKDSPSEICLIAVIGSIVVGIINLSRKITTNEDINWLRANYDLDENINYERHRSKAQAAIIHWMINPVYTRWSRFMLKEVMRLTFKSLLYFQSAPMYPIPVEILEELIQSQPRRRIEQVEGLKLQPLIQRPTSGALGSNSPTLYLSKRHLSTPKQLILTRIIIVGGSTAAISFVQKLCFSPNFVIPNITLVVDHPPAPLFSSTSSTGGAGREESKFSDDYSGCLSPGDVDDYTERELFSLGLSHRVTVVKGRLTDIDRANRAIVISDEAVLEYDILVISGHSQDCSTKRFPSTANMHPQLCANRGMFGLGNSKSDENAMKWIRSRSGSIALSGSGIAAYNAAGRLIQFGVNPERIHLLIKDKILPEFGNSELNKAVYEGLDSSGVHVHLGYSMRDVILSSQRFLEGVVINFDPEILPIKGPLPSATAVSGKDLPLDKNVHTQDPGESKTLSCTTLLCCSEKKCDFDIFSAINDSGLVYDGGIVVDQNFRTVDPYIYAMGESTKFSRIYFDSIPHHRFNARELGAHVAEHILQKYLDSSSPTVTYSRLPVGTIYVADDVKSSQKSSRVDQSALPKFLHPKTLSCDFPGGLKWYFCRLPTVASDTTHLFTVAKDNLFTLGVDTFGTVNELYYIGKSRLEERNFSQLVGMHESYLNNALFSYEQGHVKDWVAYFRESWMTPLYHDKFAALVRVLAQSLKSDKGMFTILDRVFDVSDENLDDQMVALERRKILGDRCEFLPETTQKMIENSVMEFVRSNKDTLPGVWIPPPNNQKITSIKPK